ncbi:hypothetical protein [Pseudomonas marginalis]|uniref:hypothetical protein n=1 Tax=Pseudomonas marginalis TaxID=298 RepID=UPI001639E168|nr:hypothetical protein [Pseudomonas marginalis]
MKKYYVLAMPALPLFLSGCNVLASKPNMLDDDKVKSQNNNATSNDRAFREMSLKADRKMVEAGSMSPSVLKIDEELLTIPIDSPKAIPLENKKSAIMKADNDEAHERFERAQAASASHPPVRGASQPQEQEQRMCSVNNGSATYLEPC